MNNEVEFVQNLKNRSRQKQLEMREEQEHSLIERTKGSLFKQDECAQEYL